MTDRIEQLHDLAKRCLNASADQPSPWHQIMAIRNVLAGTGLFLDNGLPDGVEFIGAQVAPTGVAVGFQDRVTGSSIWLPPSQANPSDLAAEAEIRRKAWKKNAEQFAE